EGLRSTASPAYSRFYLGSLANWAGRRRRRKRRLGPWPKLSCERPREARVELLAPLASRVRERAVRRGQAEPGELVREPQRRALRNPVAVRGPGRDEEADAAGAQRPSLAPRQQHRVVRGERRRR